MLSFAATPRAPRTGEAPRLNRADVGGHTLPDVLGVARKPQSPPSGAGGGAANGRRM
jgi:hypothetical protein